MKIAILLPNWVGDLAMATPALRAVRQQYPQAKIYGLLKPYLRDVLAGSDWVDDIIPCQHQRWLGEQGFWQTVKSLRSLQLDTMISFRGTLRGALLSLASGAQQRIGYGHQIYSSVYQRRYRPIHDEQGRQAESAVDVYLKTVAQLDCQIENKQLRLDTTAADEALTTEVWQRLKLPDSQQVVLLNGGSAQGTAKMWPTEKIAQLARDIAHQWNATVLVNCGPKERDQARQIVHLANSSGVVSLADEPQLPFGLLKGLLKRVRFAISTDSGPRHLAAAVGTPVVAIFGPMDPRLSHNYNPHETIVRLNLDCMPCNAYTCPLGHLHCMTQLSPQNVLAAAEVFWNQERRQVA